MLQVILVFILTTWNNIFLCFQSYYKKKNCAKAKYLDSESSLKNEEHFTVISKFRKWKTGKF